VIDSFWQKAVDVELGFVGYSSFLAVVVAVGLLLAGRSCRSSIDFVRLASILYFCSSYTPATRISRDAALIFFATVRALLIWGAMSHRFLRAWQAVQAILPGRRPCLFDFFIPDGPRMCLVASESMVWEIPGMIKSRRGNGEYMENG
jgi:hypothetical protein